MSSRIGELHRPDGLDEAEAGDGLKQVLVGLERQPRAERDERWHQRQPFRPAQLDYGEHILARMPLSPGSRVRGHRATRSLR